MILRANWVASGVGEPIRDGCVEILGDALGRVGRYDPAAARGRDVLDLGDALLTPGLVNPHTHLELTGYHGRLLPAPLWEWLSQLVPLRVGDDRAAREAESIRAGAWESLAAGVTTVGDISRFGEHWQILRAIPIRKVCFVELLSLADSPPRTPTELAAAVAAVEEDPLLTVGVSPHAPYSVSEAHFRAAIALAARLRRPWMTHWSETQEENRFLAGDESALPMFVRRLLPRAQLTSPGKSPIAHLAELTDAAPAGLLAHVNYIDKDEVALLARLGHTVVYCPRAHEFFGHRHHPWRQLRRAGVQVLVGTDSRASNQDLALLRELRFIATRLADAPPAGELLQLATHSAATALGLGDRVGMLQPGMQADVVAWPLPPSCRAPLEHLVHETPTPLRVWVAGQEVPLHAADQ